MTGPVLAFFLITFWCLNQGPFSEGKSPVTALLESPLLSFGFICMGAFISSFIAGEFSIRIPLTFEPFVYAFAGGLIMGVGAAFAAMSVHSVVLFNLAGIFILTSFMLTKGWIYVFFMIAGGFFGSWFFRLVILRTGALQRQIVLPEAMASKKNQTILFYGLTGVLALFVLAVGFFSVLPSGQKKGFVSVVFLLVVFGIIVERGTICMSSMLKEWFLARTAYVWRNILFAVMFLALFYQLGLKTGMFFPLKTEPFVHHILWLMGGSFLMGLGFIFADGCFIGSLWKAGQGHVVNLAGILGLLLGSGVTQFILNRSFSQDNGYDFIQIPGEMGGFISPWMFLSVLWIVGMLVLFFFRSVRYDY